MFGRRWERAFSQRQRVCISVSGSWRPSWYRIRKINMHFFEIYELVQLGDKRICLPMQEMKETRIRLLLSGRSPGVRNGNSLQYSCLENPIDRGAWWSVYGMSKSWIQLSMRVCTQNGIILLGGKQGQEILVWIEESLRNKSNQTGR